MDTPKNPYLNEATQKNTCQIFQPKKILQLKISNPKKSFDQPCHLKSGVPPLESCEAFTKVENKEWTSGRKGREKSATKVACVASVSVGFSA